MCIAKTRHAIIVFTSDGLQARGPELADEVIAATDIPTIFLRPAGFLQKYVTDQTQAIKAGTIDMAEGGQSHSLIDARDIAAEVLSNPAKHAGRAYLLAGGESFFRSRRRANDWRRDRQVRVAHERVD